MQNETKITMQIADELAQKRAATTRRWLEGRSVASPIYSIAHGKKTPGDGFTRLETPEREGIHTGGLYLSPDGEEVWKPLDAMPYQNSPVRVGTQEAEALECMWGKPGFPSNWWVELANGRLWLIRPRCLVVGETYPLSAVTLEQASTIEAAVRNLNAHHWEISDHLNVAIDRTGEAFILDLSNAHHRKTRASASLRADDTAALERWLKLVGYEHIAELRHAARGVLQTEEWIFGDYWQTHQHVYQAGAIDPETARALDGLLREHKDQEWLIMPRPLGAEAIAELGLVWGYSPIPYQ